MLPSTSPFVLSRRFGVLGFAFIAMLFMAGGFGFYQHKAKAIVREQHQILAAIGELKSAQIQGWRKERLLDAREAAKGPLVRHEVGEFLRDPNSPKVPANLLEQMQLNKMVDVYSSTLLFTLNGQVLLSTEDSISPESPETQRAVAAAVAGQGSVFSDFFKHADGLTYIDIATAIRDAEGRPLSVMVLRSNASAFLFPLVQTWPLPNYSAETVLIVRIGDEAVTPHKRRFEAETDPRWHQPLTSTTPGVLAVLGRQGLVEGKDSRGKLVLADLRAVPGSPWFLENKIDKDEAMAQLYSEAMLIGFITGASILLAGALFAFYYRHRQAESFRALYESEQMERATEKALQKSEDRYRDLIDNSRELIAITDLEGNFVSVNETGLRISGYSCEALLKMNMADLITPKMRNLFPAFLANIQAHGTANGIIQVLNAQGERRFWDYVSTVRVDGVAAPMVRCMALDITERRQAEKALRASHERFELANRATFNVIWDWDLKTNIFWRNDHFQSLFGYSREEVDVSYESTTSRIHPADLERVEEGMHSAIEDGSEFWADQYRLRRKDGSYAMVEDRAIITRGIDGHAIRMLGAMRDISERYQAEEEQKQLDLALQEASIELGVATKANLAKSDFLSAMSHELRTPLIGVTGMLEVLTQSKLDTEQRQVVDIIHDSSESLLQIIGDILDFSKIEANKLELVPHTFSSRTLLESLSQIFKSAAFTKGLDLIVEVDPGVAPAHVADALRIRQILNNFLSNAVKFTERGSITLRLRLLGSRNGTESLAFEVQDSGIGVSPENMLKLFKPFTQAEASTTRRFGGTGLGLTISRRLAELMGGSLTIQSTLGQGTTIALTVNLAVGNAQEIVKADGLVPSQIVPTRPTPSIEAAMLERSLILLAEDHPTNRTVLTQQINRAGYALEVAVDGQEAFEKLQSGRYSLLLTDLHMPRMDGYQLTEAMREMERIQGSPRTPILALTANALGGEAERCLELGMDDFLIKPVTIPLLASKLHQWMPYVKREASEAQATPASPSLEVTECVPILDSKILLDLCGGNATTAQEILSDFIATTKADLLVMQDFLQQNEKPGVARQAHRIKGSAAMIGARDLADRAKNLEFYAKTETAEWETVMEHMAGIQEALQLLGAAPK
jgi:PAS domain S-box-containing protein